jgi:3-oxoacyl-[acyl-carrier-protein] synthase-3
LGDTTSKSASPLDRNRLLFGAAGSAVLVEKSSGAPEMLFGLKSDGNRFKTIITPAGAFRNRNASREREPWFDGNIRSDYDVFINGADVFSFTMTDVPRLFEEFLDHFSLRTEEFDCLLLHQANLWIMKRIARKLKIPAEKMPVSLDRYANSSQATIPVTICDAFAGVQDRHIHALASGFGVGLSWGVASLDFDTNDVFPIIHTDDFYTDGAVSHV